MTSAYGVRHFWAVSFDGKIRILAGSQHDDNAKREAEKIWPGCTWLGAVAEFAQTPDQCFVYKTAYFMKD